MASTDTTDETRYPTHQAAAECDLPSVVEPYRGFTFTVAPSYGTHSTWDRETGESFYLRRSLYWRATTMRQGRTVYLGHGTDPGRLAKKARKAIDIMLLDDEQRIAVTRLIGTKTKYEGDDNGTPLPHANRMDALMRLTGTMGMKAPAVGDTAWVWGMNRWRRGMVTKINAKRAEVAYTTPSSDGRIYRPVRAFADIWVEG